MAITKGETIEEITWFLEAVKRSACMVAEKYGESKNWSPEYCMADAAPAITSAVQKVFPSIIRLNCWFHVSQSILRKMAAMKIRRSVRAPIFKDLQQLRCARDKRQFKIWSNHFINKWQENAPEVVEYLKKQYLDSMEWTSAFYWGAADTPSALIICSTNNGIESHHRYLKRSVFKKKKIPWKRAYRELLAHIATDSTSGYYVTETLDYNSARVRKIRRAGMVFRRDPRFLTRENLGNEHWITSEGFEGHLYNFGYRSDLVPSVIDGDFNPFIPGRERDALTFVPAVDDDIELPPPRGAVCTCHTFVSMKLCEHICAILMNEERITLPPNIPRNRNPVLNRRGSPEKRRGRRSIRSSLKRALEDSLTENQRDGLAVDSHDGDMLSEDPLSLIDTSPVEHTVPSSSSNHNHALHPSVVDVYDDSTRLTVKDIGRSHGMQLRSRP
jgi:hypothetical protein